MAKSKALTVRIRMYRQGLGDCFLVTFTKKGKKEFNLMIDCGLLQGTSNAQQIMQAVAADIESTLTLEKTVNGQTKKWLDAVALTHEHVDHISGFSQAQQTFDRIHFGQVWASWLDDENHPQYKAVRERFHKQVTGLKAALSRMSSPEQQGLKETVNALVNEFFEAGVLGASGDTNGRSPAWDYALKKSVANPKYCRPGELLSIDGFENVRFYVLGPPEDYETFTQVNPPREETYRHEGSNFAVADSFFAAVAGQNDLFDAGLYQPFENHLRIDAETEAPKTEFFKTHYGFDADAKGSWRRINDDWLTMAGTLALNLDTYTNNTCLALAIELVDSKKVLLFPGDAQFANWISWQKLSWQVDDGQGTKRQVKVEDLLKQTVFYKVGHHGSHNATLKQHGLELMSNAELVAMIPVNREQARSKITKTNPNGWEMPEENLFARLQERTRGRVVLADEGDDTNLKDRCKDKNFLKKVKFQGSFVRNTEISPKAEPLSVELTIQG